MKGNTIGILSIVFGLLCAIVGLVFSIIGLVRYPAGSSGKTLSVIGLILSILNGAGSLYVGSSSGLF